MAKELRSKLKKEKKKTGGIETGMSSIEVALEELSVLFLYSCILMSLLQVKIKKIHLEILASSRSSHRIVE